MDEPMNYALVGEDGAVENIIWLNDANAGDFQSAVCVADRPVAIGDHYTDGVFTRDGEPVLTFSELLAATENPDV